MDKKERKKHKLLLVAPSGREYKLGFLSPCKNGVVLGTAKSEEVDTSHLTIIFKGETLSSHITPQERLEKRRYFHHLSKKQIVKKFQTSIEEKLIYPLPPEKMSQEVMYITQEFENWLNTIMTTLYEERDSPREIIHVLNFKKLLEKLPRLIEDLTKSPSSFLGLCKAKEILEDELKIAGVTDRGLLIVPFINQLYSVDFSLLTNFSFDPTLEEREISSPLNEIYHSMGIPQYMKEIEKNKFLEKLLSKDR